MKNVESDDNDMMPHTSDSFASSRGLNAELEAARNATDNHIAGVTPSRKSKIICDVNLHIV